MPSSPFRSLISRESRRSRFLVALGLVVVSTLLPGVGEAQDRAVVAPFTGVGVEGDGNPSLRLAWFDSAGLSQGVTVKTKHCVEQIFESIGVWIEWHEPSSVSNGDEPEDAYYLKVILFDKEPAAMGHPADAMGISIGTDFPPDAVWLFHPVIGRALQGSRRRRPLSSEELGRAYGRVLAHEVIHAIANDMRHADSGLMAPAQNRNVLLSAGRHIDADSEAAFRRGIERLRLQGQVVSGH